MEQSTNERKAEEFVKRTRERADKMRAEKQAQKLGVNLGASVRVAGC